MAAQMATVARQHVLVLLVKKQKQARGFDRTSGEDEMACLNAQGSAIGRAGYDSTVEFVDNVTIRSRGVEDNSEIRTRAQVGFEQVENISLSKRRPFRKPWKVVSRCTQWLDQFGRIVIIGRQIK